MLTRPLPLVVLSFSLLACNPPPPSAQGIPQDETVIPSKPLQLKAGKPVALLPGERWFKSVRQLTFGGENAEGYFSHDGRKLIFQSKRPPFQCDQIFVLDLESDAEPKLVSTGLGATTCSYFLRGDRGIVYASTHAADPKCPTPVALYKGRYVWAVRETFELWKADVDGKNPVRLTDQPGYDAEATVCRVTGRMVFTSTRDGDLEIYSMEQDGSDLKRLTQHVGYDGGPFFAHNGAQICFRRAFFKDDAERNESIEFLKHHVVVPSRLEIMVMDRDGQNVRQVTSNGKANFAPYFFPDDKRLIFSSNSTDPDPKGRNFELLAIDLDGKNQVQITNNPSFDGFPMFSPDGKHLVFASNRYGKERGETNLFLAEWDPQGSVVVAETRPGEASTGK